MKVIILFCSVVLLLSTPVHAEPSYEKTFDFIKSKYPKKHIVTEDLKHIKTTSIIELKSSKRCLLQVKRTDYYTVKKRGQKGKGQRVFKTNIPLSRIDPTKIQFEHGHVYLFAIENNEEFTTKTNRVLEKNTVPFFFANPSQAICDGNSCTFKDSWANSEFRLRKDYLKSPSAENSERVAKAFKHLVKLCGGKGELF